MLSKSVVDLSRPTCRPQRTLDTSALLEVRGHSSKQRPFANFRPSPAIHQVCSNVCVSSCTLNKPTELRLSLKAVSADAHYAL